MTTAYYTAQATNRSNIVSAIVAIALNHIASRTVSSMAAAAAE